MCNAFRDLGIVLLLNKNQVHERIHGRIGGSIERFDLLFEVRKFVALICSPNQLSQIGDHPGFERWFSEDSSSFGALEEPARNLGGANITVERTHGRTLCVGHRPFVPCSVPFLGRSSALPADQILQSWVLMLRVSRGSVLGRIGDIRTTTEQFPCIVVQAHLHSVFCEFSKIPALDGTQVVALADTLQGARSRLKGGFEIFANSL